MRPYYPTRLRDQVQVPSNLTSSYSPDSANRKHNNLKFTDFQDQIQVSMIDEVNKEQSIRCKLRNYVLRGGFRETSHVHIVTEQHKSVHTENYISTNTCFMKLWIPPRLCLSIFLSSTWEDVSIERDLLLQKILPKIVAVGNQSRLKVSLIEACDVIADCSGVVLDSGRIWIDSANKIVQCFSDSDINLFFISLLSERYGYCSLPHTIQLHRLDDESIQPDAKAMASNWYKVDSNDLQPNVCVSKGSLLSIEDFDLRITEQMQKSVGSLPKLRDTLAGLPFDHLSDFLITGQSILEWEIALAIALSEKSSLLPPSSSSSSSSAGILWVHREFDRASVSRSVHQQELILLDNQPVANPVSQFCDTESANNPKLSSLKEKLSKMSPSILERKDFLNLNMYSMNNKYSALYKRNNWHRYMVEWEDFMESRLLSAVQEAARVNASWAEDGCGMGLPGVELEEMFLHSQIASIAAERFVAREEYLNRGLQHLQQSYTHLEQQRSPKLVAEPRCAITLCIVGSNGSGKRSLVAKLADLFFKYQQTMKDCEEMCNRPVLIRFCGVSARSRESTSLLWSLCRQIELLFAYPATKRGELDGIIETTTYFHYLALKHPIVLFICEVDKLLDSHTFIRTMSTWKLHPSSQIILTVDGHTSSALSQKSGSYGRRYSNFACLLRDRGGYTSCDEVLSMMQVPRISLIDYSLVFPGDFRLRKCELSTNTVRNMITIEHMGENAVSLFDELLKQKGRKLSQSQHKYVKGKLLSNPNTIFTTLAATVCQHWKNNTVPSLENDEHDLVHHLISCVESVVVVVGGSSSNESSLHLALGLLATSRYGLTFEELEDLLLLNRINNLEFSISSQQQRTALRDHLIGTRCVQQVGARLHFVHEQVRFSIASTLSEDESLNFHRLLGLYFSDLIPSTVDKTYSHQSEQLLPRLQKVIEHANKYKESTLPDCSSRNKKDPTPIRSRSTGAASSVLEYLAAMVANPRNRFDSDWSMKSVSFVNVRRCENAVHHLLEANLLTAAVKELCSIDSVISRVAFGQHLELKKQLNYLLRKVYQSMFFDTEIYLESMDVLSLFDGSIDDVELELMYDTVDHFYRWFMGAGARLTQAALIQQLSLSCSLQPISSVVRKEFYQRYYFNCETPNYRFKNVPIVTNDSLKRCFSIGGSERDFDAKVFNLGFSDLFFHTCAWSPDGSSLAAAGDSSDVYIFSMSSGSVAGILFGHQGNVYGLSWSLSGGSAKEKLFLASCSSDYSVKIWSPDTGQAVQTLTGHKSAVVRVIWQPDATFTVASASLDNTIRLWNGFSGQVLHVLMVEDNGSPCIGLSFYKIKNANPVLISASRGGQVILWNALTGTCIAKRQNSCSLTAFNASRDGRRLACGQDDGRIIVLDTDTLLTKQAIIEPSHGRVDEVEVGTEVIAILSTEKVSDRSVASLTFSFDGRSLLAAYSSASNLPIEVLHQDPPTIPIITDGTSTATTTTTARTSKGHIMDCKAMIYQWEISSGNHLGCYDNQGSTAAGVDVAAIQMSPDGKQFVSCYANGCMSVWNYFKVPPLYKGPPLRHLSPVRFVSWLPVAFCEDRNRWTTSSSDKRIADHHMFASGADDGSVHVWDAREHSLLFSFSAQPAGLLAMAVCPTVVERNGTFHDSDDICLQLATAAPDNTSIALMHISIIINDSKASSSGIANGRKEKSFLTEIRRLDSNDILLSGHTKGVRCLEYCSYSSLTLLASGSDDSSIKLWNSVDGSKLWELLDHHDCIYSLSWSPDGLRLASGSGDYCEPVIGLWDTSNLIESLTSVDNTTVTAMSTTEPMVLLNNLLYGHHYSEITTLRWSPDSQKLLSFSCLRDSSLVLLWDFETTSRTIVQGGSPDDLILTGSWSLDSLYIALTMKSGEVHIFDCKGMSVVWILNNSMGSAFSPAMQQERNQILQYSTITAQCGVLREVRAATPPVWSGDGKNIIYGCNDGTLTFWDAILSFT